MKCLIINGDDFGASPGISRGIIEAHRHGILTSTSMMVNTPSSAEAAKMAATVRHLSVGLHVDLPEEPGGSPERARDELQKQFARFEELMGRPPTHLDSHHNVHRLPQVLPFFLELAQEHDLPLREHSTVRYFSKFYGQWGGRPHPEQIGVESLVQMLENEVGEGFTELSCHPGYVDPEYHTGYAAEREIELRALCDPRVRAVLAMKSIHLVSYHLLNGHAKASPI